MIAVYIMISLVWLNTVTVRASECNYNSDANYFSCADRGLFPNYNDQTCTQYYSCMKHTDGYYQILKTCNNGTFFNRDTNKCDWFYQCPCESDILPNIQLSSQVSSDQETKCIDNTTETFDCSTVTKSGCYADPSSSFCDKYIYCYIAPSGKVYQNQNNCNVGTFFNINGNVCGCSVEAGFTCPCKKE